MSASLSLAQILFSQGFGTRRHVAALIANGEVQVGGAVFDDPHAALPVEGLHFTVQGRSWPYHAKALVLLHKPAGYECSGKSRHHPSILTLLPAPLRERGVQSVGRLDEDTTGLLLLTDDGPLIHRLTSPKHHVAKVYEVTCKHPLAADTVTRLRGGVVLDDDPEPVAALACEATGELSLRMTLTEGRYHQVKRMLAAVGNRALALHRSAVGGLVLDSAALPPGQWRWLDADDRARLTAPR